jgi:hypothetical protein
MLTTIEATYENGQIIWDEPPLMKEKRKVLVTFLEKDENQPIIKGGAVRLGSLKGKISIPDDFNPLDDLKEYM